MNQSVVLELAAARFDFHRSDGIAAATGFAQRKTQRKKIFQKKRQQKKKPPSLSINRWQSAPETNSLFAALLNSHSRIEHQ